MPTISQIERDSAGNLPAAVWPGGYPLYYMTKDGGILCPTCANGGNGSLAQDPEAQDDPQWRLVGADVHWEGPSMTCEHCGGEIESAYGDPDGED